MIALIFLVAALVLFIVAAAGVAVARLTQGCRPGMPCSQPTRRQPPLKEKPCT